MPHFGWAIWLAITVVPALFAQAPARVLGTVVTAEASALIVKTEAGETLSIQTTPNVRVQRVAPGERDLSKAETIALADLAAGDRVLVRGSKAADAFRADSVIVMSARAIAQRDQATQRAWQERGVFGVVEQVNAAASEVRIAGRANGTEPAPSVLVKIPEKASVKRYAPDSVRFADAVSSNVSEIKKGDQLRAMGEKSADGTQVNAEQVVFGTFQTIAATLSAVQPDKNELAVKDIQSGKMLRVYIKPDTQLKKMGFPGGGMGMRPGANGGPAGPGGPPANGPARGRMMGAGGRAPDVAAMLERMPPTTVAELKPGDTVIVSSTAGAKTDELTAIVLLAGAEPIIDMLRARGEAARGQDPLAGGSSLDRGLEGMMGMPTQ